MDMHYLDYAATSPVRPEIAERYGDYCRRYGGNPHGGTCYAEQLRRALLTAQRRLLNVLGADESQCRILWTSGSTEALNLAISSLQKAQIPLWTDAGAHPAMLKTALSQKDAKLLPLDAHGRIDLSVLALTDSMSSRCLAVCHLNNETGAIQDLTAIRNALPPHSRLLVDASQSFTRCPLLWQEAKLDAVVLSSRKIGGPAAVGALIVRNDCPLSPMLLGGGQQGGFRSGTLDLVGILLFVDAVELAVPQSKSEHAHIKQLATMLWDGLESLALPGYRRLSPIDGYDGINAFALKGYDGAVLMRLLAADHQIIVSSGSACSAETKETSHVLRAMGVDETTARGMLRVSFGYASTAEDIAALLHALPQVVRNY